jgi:hypothetical protein
MKLKDEPLGKLRGKQNYNGILFSIVCICFGILYVRPISLEMWFVAIAIMAPTFWLVFVTPQFLDIWKSRSRYVYRSWIVFGIKLAFFILVAEVAAPFIETTIAKWLDA